MAGLYVIGGALTMAGALIPAMGGSNGWAGLCLVGLAAVFAGAFGDRR
jgi:hypothetical protein